MNENLKAWYTKEQLELAASISLGDKPIVDKIKELFEGLGDPLLAKEEVSQLLGINIQQQDLEEALASLVHSGALERSKITNRPLDSDGTILYRLKDFPWSELTILATEAELSDKTKRYQFTCDGRLIRSFAKVDRLDALSGQGNQRAEIERHVRQISEGITDGVQIPNSILIVFSADHFADDDTDQPPASFIKMRPLSDVIETAHPSANGSVAQRLRTVEIKIPYRAAAFDDEKNCLLVDGQQRTAALSLVDVDSVPEYYLSVNAVVADPDEAKRIFQVANSTVKISTEFSRALLATMEEAPGYLRKERTKAIAVKHLSIDDNDSPFFGLAQHPGVKSDKRPPIAFNSLFQVVSIFAESALPVDEDATKLAEVISKSFQIVRSVWKESWGLRPNQSRLMHGAGLRSVSSLLVNHLEANYKIYEYDLTKQAVWDDLRASLNRLATRIQWTPEQALNGTAVQKKTYLEEIANRQNTNQDIAALTALLLKESTHLDKEASKAAKK
ncbi:DGQHR domain-containing protein [Azospirillum melinis]|uniref:DGQHR domain-containing protein n=1 Tax=Azospirillum melinis TaxID=328839 RepID=A0ABX2KIS5_9PROT|nr:DGQHR domain-containing protein [Azospirillum melinis]MBP2305993.1 DGQHR domain-containing protein [Azospirillum melinis]NUB03498.1 DGQHR domain-containing protein [Azospirillum melinis]